MKTAAIFSFLTCCLLTSAKTDSFRQSIKVSPFCKVAFPEKISLLDREGLFNTLPGVLINYSRPFDDANFLEVQMAFGYRQYRQKGAYIFHREERLSVASVGVGVGNRIQVTSLFATSVVVGAGWSRGLYKEITVDGAHPLSFSQLFGQLGLKFHLQFSPKWSMNLSSQYKAGRFNWGDGYEKGNAFQGGMLAEYLAIERRF